MGQWNMVERGLQRQSGGERQEDCETERDRSAHVRGCLTCPSILALPSYLCSPLLHSTYSLDIWIAHMCTTCSVFHSLRCSHLSETFLCNI